MKHISGLSSLGRSVLKLLWASGLILSGIPALAQQGGGGIHPAPPPSTPASPSTKPTTAPPPQPPHFPSATNPWDQNELIQRSSNKQVSSKIVKNDTCFLPPLNGPLPATVGVADLQIPGKAQRDHSDGCVAMGNNNTAEAESHFRKAVKQWPKYWAAWVVLGQLLEAQQKTKEADDACSQPLATEAGYLPAYLCLADISARSESWDKVLSLSNRAMAIDPSVAVAYDYHAAANFHLHNLPAAEKSALRAVELDKNNTDPRIHFLLAQIYEAKGDHAGEAAQLREYLKYTRNPDDVAMIKQYLSDLDEHAK
jgi:tetratricopeptide (TPR) repeat protein